MKSLLALVLFCALSLSHASAANPAETPAQAVTTCLKSMLNQDWTRMCDYLPAADLQKLEQTMRSSLDQLVPDAAERARIGALKGVAFCAKAMAIQFQQEPGALKMLARPGMVLEEKISPDRQSATVRFTATYEGLPGRTETNTAVLVREAGAWKMRDMKSGGPPAAGPR